MRVNFVVLWAFLNKSTISILFPIGCLFLPGYGNDKGSGMLFESYFFYELLPVYSWLPALLLTLLGLLDLQTYLNGKAILRPRTISLLIIGAMCYLILDALVWRFHFSKTPQIGTIFVFVLLLYRLLVRSGLSPKS